MTRRKRRKFPSTTTENGLDAGIYTGFENDFHEFSRKPIDKAFRSTYTNGVCM